MIYFENYKNINIDNIIYFSGILKINKNKENIVELDNNKQFTVNDENINRALHNSLVVVELLHEKKCKIINIIKIPDIIIPGILYTHSKITYGTNKKNMPIYLFKPESNKYPKFLVASNIKSKNKNANTNYYCTIKFTKWDTSSKYPNGSIINMIGMVGDIESENEYILYKNEIAFKNLKKLNISEDVNSIIEKEIINRINYKDILTFSIDPPNCRDIDDAFHIKLLDEVYELGVHIADVSHFITSEYDNLFENRTTSIYTPIKTINMLPSIYSENICSLLENNNRLAYSVIYRFDKNYELIDYNIKKTIINCNKNLSYNEAENYLYNDNNNYSNNLKILLNIANQLNIIEKNNNIEDCNSHFIVESLMVLTNSKIAETMYNLNKQFTILRIHENNDNNLDKKEINDENVYNFLKILQTNSAKYNVAENLDITEINHNGLNIKYYTHFTSPIRRYIDILVHRYLYKLSNNILSENSQEYLEIICKNANIINKKIKKADRDYNKLKLLKILSENNNILNEIAHIIDMNIKGKLTIFIKKFNLSIKFNLFSKKIDDIINFDLTNNQLKILNIQNEKKIYINLYQEISISINSILLNDRLDEKLKINIINPCLNILLE